MSKKDTETPEAFDPLAASKTFLAHGHAGWLGLKYSAHGENWVELELPWRKDLLGEPDRPVLASGPIISLMDMASGMAVWQANKTFQAIATLDLRVDYQRPSRERSAVWGRVECYRITRSAAFVRGVAHDGDPDDPVARIAGVFMKVNFDPRIDWEEPQEARAPGLSPAPIDLPPYARSLGMEVFSLDEPMPVITLAFGPKAVGRQDIFHGGATAGLLEVAGYSALRARLEEKGRSARLKPVNITVQYLAAGLSNPSFAMGRVTRLGRRNANIAVEAWQYDRSRPIASAVMNILMAED